MIYDEENMIDDAVALFKAELTNEIDAVNLEKGAVSGDALFLDNISNQDYIFETLDSTVLNIAGYFVMYGLKTTNPTSPSIDNFIDGVTMTFLVATFDNGEENRQETLKKLLRYRKALKQVIMKNPDVFRGYAKPLVASLKPDAFPFDRKNIILTMGVDIIASVTAN